MVYWDAFLRILIVALVAYIAVTLWRRYEFYNDLKTDPNARHAPGILKPFRTGIARHYLRLLAMFILAMSVAFIVRWVFTYLGVNPLRVMDWSW